MVQLSNPYMTTGKTIALTIQTFIRKVISLLFNMLSMFVIAFLPRSKHLLISWLQSPSAVCVYVYIYTHTPIYINIQKPKIMASGPITSWQINGEKMETVTYFIFLGSKITADLKLTSAMKLKDTCSLEEKL